MQYFCLSRQARGQLLEEILVRFLVESYRHPFKALLYRTRDDTDSSWLLRQSNLYSIRLAQVLPSHCSATSEYKGLFSIEILFFTFFMLPDFNTLALNDPIAMTYSGLSQTQSALFPTHLWITSFRRRPERKSPGMTWPLLLLFCKTSMEWIKKDSNFRGFVLSGPCACRVSLQQSTETFLGTEQDITKPKESNSQATSRKIVLSTKNRRNRLSGRLILDMNLDYRKR